MAQTKFSLKDIPKEYLDISIRDEPPRTVKNKVQSRLTVVESICYQGVDEEPTPYESRYSRQLESDEQPYSRKVKVTEEWTTLDLGWVKENVGLVHIVNNTKEGSQIPTEEEKAELAAKIVEIKEATGFCSWLIHPGESMRGCPESPSHLRIRCRSGEARVTISVIPN